MRSRRPKSEQMERKPVYRANGFFLASTKRIARAQKAASPQKVCLASPEEKKAEIKRKPMSGGNQFANGRVQGAALFDATNSKRKGSRANRTRRTACSSVQ